jgi:hypothetical protein
MHQHVAPDPGGAFGVTSSCAEFVACGAISLGKTVSWATVAVYTFFLDCQDREDRISRYKDDVLVLAPAAWVYSVVKAIGER